MGKGRLACPQARPIRIDFTATAQWRMKRNPQGEWSWDTTSRPNPSACFAHVVVRKEIRFYHEEHEGDRRAQREVTRKGKHTTCSGIPSCNTLRALLRPSCASW